MVEFINLDTVQHAEKVEMPPGAAVFAVGRKLSPTSSCLAMIFGISASSTALSCAAVISPVAALSRAALSGPERNSEPTWSARNGGLVRAVMGRLSRRFLDRSFHCRVQL